MRYTYVVLEAKRQSLSVQSLEKKPAKNMKARGAISLNVPVRYSWLGLGPFLSLV